MNAFVRVVQAGSFTKAANTLNVPKASITRLVQQLETLLEVRLIHRTTRALTLTAEGATYYERVVRLLADLEDIEADTRSALAKPSGWINVEVSVALGTMVIAPALPEFFERCPGIEVNLTANNRDVDLVADNLDCAIRVGSIADQSLVARRIGGFHFTTCAAPSYLKRRGTPRHPDDLLKAHSTVGMVSDRLGGPLPFVFTQGAQRLEFTPPHLFQVNDTNGLVAGAIAGLGIMQAPGFAAQAAIASGQLFPLLEDWPSDVHSMSVVYPPNRYLSAKVRVFVDWIVEMFARTPGLNRR